MAAFIVAVFVLATAAGCSRAPEPAPVQRTSPEVKALGPYPMNVGVRSGRVTLTLVGVRVMAADDSAGSFVRKIGPTGPGPAPSGTRFVDVTVKVDEPVELKATRGGPWDTPELFGVPVVVADGKTIRAGFRVRSFESGKTGTYQEQMEFAVPEHAASVVLRLPLARATSEVVSFRLW